MDTVLLVIHMMLAVALIMVILMQRSAQDGGGLMGGSSTMGGLFTARGSANLLTRTTAVLATAFICTSLLLGIIAGHAHRAQSVADQVAPIVNEAADKAAAAKDEGAKKNEATPSETPKAPVAPQVPVSK